MTDGRTDGRTDRRKKRLIGARATALPKNPIQSLTNVSGRKTTKPLTEITNIQMQNAKEY